MMRGIGRSAASSCVECRRTIPARAVGCRQRVARALSDGCRAASQCAVWVTDENGAELEDAHRYNTGFDFKPTKSGQQVNITVTARDGQSSQTYRLTIRRVGQPARITRVEFFNLRSGQTEYRPGDTVDVLLG